MLVRNTGLLCKHNSERPPWRLSAAALTMACTLPLASHTMSPRRSAGRHIFSGSRLLCTRPVLRNRQLQGWRPAEVSETEGAPQVRSSIPILDHAHPGVLHAGLGMPQLHSVTWHGCCGVRLASCM